MKIFRIKIQMIITLFIFSFVLGSFETVKAAENEKQTVRIGYYPTADYQDVKEDGTRFGFSYDYFVQIKKYTRWNYEFVEASYADCMKMLAAGEIDIMSGLTKSADREELYIFSEYSNSNSQNKLYAKAEDQNLFYESFDTFDGARIAMTNGMRTDEITEYAQNYGFQYEPVYYQSPSEMEEALNDGEVDMIYASYVSNSADTKIVAMMKKIPLYYATTKSKPELAKELDRALQKIIDNNPEFYTQMSEKYRSDGANVSATFTREEIDYIHSGQQIYLIVNPDWAPICWYDAKSGEYRGIVLDLLEELKKYSGLDIVPCTGEDFDAMAKENPEIMGNALAITQDDTAWAEMRSVIMTNHIVSNSVVLITKKGSHWTGVTQESVIALPEGYYINFALAQELEKNEVQYYDTIEECLRAVNRGDADATYVNDLVSSYYVSMLKYSNLYPASDSGIQENLAFGVYKESATPLLSILDKSLLCIGRDRINHIVVKYSSAEEGFSIGGLFYSNPVLVSSITVLLCAMVYFIIYLRVREVNAIRQANQEKTLARFMGYVCATNENVMEVNLKDYTAQSYILNDAGEVEIKTFPYHQTHGKNYNNDIYPEDYERVATNLSEEVMDQLIEQEDMRYFECRAKGRDGKYQWFSYSIRAIPKDEKHPQNFILFKKNINDAKLEEQAQRQALKDALENARYASDAKSNFLSRVSHEIRTPLNAIIGYLSIARQADSRKEDVDECIKNSEIAARHLLNMIKDFLDMSSIESGKMELAKESFSLRELIENLAAMFHNEAHKKGISFEIKIQKLTREWVIGDRVRLNQILINLLSNAVKFTEAEGKVSLVVTQMNECAENIQIKFEVKDTGIGMSEEYLKRIFKPFEQESAKSGQKFGGTGLGLSIAWNLITMMGGSIDVKSIQGAGSTFTVILSLDAASEQDKIQLQQDFSKVRALVVDNEKNDCDYIKSLLKRCGVKCDTVQSGKKAIQKIKTRKDTEYGYDLCILDWNMPEMNGIETTKKIRRECDEAIPIVIVTALDTNAIVREAKEAGVTEVLAKPLFQSSMFDLLVNLFGKYEPVIEEEEKKADFSGMRLLMAEDNEMNMDIAVRVLKRAGFMVDTAVDGKEALDTFTASGEGTYQAILMDIQMPVMDGYEATRQIRASKHPQAESIPIIAVSANAFEEDVAMSLACGMNTHIAKPINYSKLYAALVKYLIRK